MTWLLCLPLLLLLFRGLYLCLLIRSVSPLDGKKPVHLVVVYGFQKADDDDDAEKLSLTDQLFGAALCELALVGKRQLCVTSGDFNMEPTKILVC